jgi:hypothetical protein
VIDLHGIAGFDWDDANARKSETKHSVSQAKAEEVFLDPNVVIALDIAHSRDEERFHAFGLTMVGRPLLVSFTLRGNQTLVRVISARPMSVKERRRYAEEG